MRAIIQRVSKAHILINAEQERRIGKGYVIFLGIGHDDQEEEAVKLWRKIINLRIFADQAGKSNLNLSAVGGSVLIVSQFTLFANCKKGNRPSFTESANAKHGESLYNYFVELAQKELTHVKTGSFGANMQVTLTNDGPFTIYLDTDSL